MSKQASPKKNPKLRNCNNTFFSMAVSTVDSNTYSFLYLKQDKNELTSKYSLVGVVLVASTHTGC